MKNNISKFLPIFIVSVFCVTLISQGSASAAPIHMGTSKASCIEGMRARDSKGDPIYSNQQIKEYGLGRLAKREAKLNEIDTILAPTRANYNYYNSKLPTVQSAIDAINQKKTESLGGIPYDATYNFTFSNVPPRTLDMNYLESVYANARNVLNSSKQTLNNTPVNNQGRLALMTASCALIWDAQVYSTVLPTAKRSYVLSRVDILNLMNSGLNVSRQQTIAGVYKAKKAIDPKFDADGSISSSAGFSANPLAQQGALSEVASQAGVDSTALNSRLNQIADQILEYNDAGELGSTFGEVLSTPATKPR